MSDDVAVGGGSAIAPPRVPPEPGHPAHSYRAILKSSAIIGGSSVINVGIGIVRTKFMAVLLGPAGYGVMGAYMLIVELTRLVAQMGINASGVRQIADAVATEDTVRVARTVIALRRAAFACALLGGGLLVAFAAPVSHLSFGDESHAGPIALLALAVFFAAITGAQGALLQGMRRISDLARLQIIGGLAGTVTGIVTVYLFGEAGIAPTLVVVAACSLAASWWYARRVRIDRVAMPAREVVAESSGLLKLGIAFMASGLLTTGAAFAVRTLVLRELGLEAAGIYYAAWTLGGLYIGFILQALGTDFYPRLVGVAADDAACNRLVNEQVRISLLLALPGVLATVTFAPVVVAIFYSARFAEAAEVLRWICLGMALRVLTWPLAYILVARTRQVLFFSVDAAWTVVNIALTWFCVQRFGVDGAGIAFFGSYAFHAAVVYPICRRLSGFRWSAVNRRTFTFGFALVAAVFAAFRVLPLPAALAFGFLASAGSAIVSVRTLLQLTSAPGLPRSLVRLLQLGRSTG
jgi:PST family polysaccharide transporter